MHKMHDKVRFYVVDEYLVSRAGMSERHGAACGAGRAVTNARAECAPRSLYVGMTEKALLFERYAEARDVGCGAAVMIACAVAYRCGSVSCGLARGSAMCVEWRGWMLSCFLVTLLEFRVVAVDRAGDLSDVDQDDCARMAPPGRRGPDADRA
eukprot:268568-Chlamydomonas_euryale.AAC.1